MSVFKIIISGLIGQTGSSGRPRNGRRRAVTLAATRVDSTSSDEFEATNDGKGGSNGGSRRYPTLRRRNSRDLLSNDASKTSVHTTTTEAICHDSNGHSKPRYCSLLSILDSMSLAITTKQKLSKWAK